MRELKASQAPWSIYGDWAIKDNNGRVIGQFEPLNDDLSCGNTAESFANAHLIAAAPELYEMLERISAPFGREDVSDEEIDAVLAKARGEQS